MSGEGGLYSQSTNVNQAWRGARQEGQAASGFCASAVSGRTSPWLCRFVVKPQMQPRFDSPIEKRNMPQRSRLYCRLLDSTASRH